MCDLAEEKLQVHKVSWKYKKKKHLLTCYDRKGQKNLENQLSGQTQNQSLRESQNDDVQAHTAVHEAGLRSWLP